MAFPVNAVDEILLVEEFGAAVQALAEVLGQPDGGAVLRYRTHLLFWFDQTDG
jgi:hypothetical protein